jgi:hypothetical protein
MCIACTTMRKPKIDLDETQFEAGFAALLAKAPANSIQGSAFSSVLANQPPCFDIGPSPKPRQFTELVSLVPIRTGGRGESGVRANFPMMSGHRPGLPYPTSY